METTKPETGGKAGAEELRRQQILQAAFEVAGESGLGALTVRATASRARVSHALVLFYFGTKIRLLHELLDWMIEKNTTVLQISPALAVVPDARDRLHGLLRQEMLRVANEPRHVRLFFEYWALGGRHPQIRTRIGQELERYRVAFRTIMQELLTAEPATLGGTTADAMAAVAVSWIQGCAVQAMIDPDRFEMDEYLAAVRVIVGKLLPT